ncbi:MAG: ImmA/IrrE family metallo-endopeptidase [Clostridium paraputrificum]
MKSYKKKSAEEKKKEVDQLITSAEDKIQKCFDTPEQIKELVDYMSRFYNYSLRNALLIQEQFLGALAVGSYTFWKEKGYIVNKGEKGIKILVPNKLSDYFINEKGEEVKVKNANVEEKKLIEQGKIEVLEGKIVFNQGYVFDISQTNAKAEELPKVFPNRWIDGEVKDYDLMYKAMENIAKKIGVKIIYPKDELGAVKGVSYPATKEVALNPRNTQLQNVKTLIHELTHAKLHTMETRERYSVNAKEFQAELSAYTVCKYFGLDTSEYSFRYIKSWTKDIELKDKEKLLNEVRETVKEYIGVIEHTLVNDKDIRLEKEGNEYMNRNEYHKKENKELDITKEFITVKDLNLEDGSFIQKGTSFFIEGDIDGKYSLHFETKEGNIYSNEFGDEYYFNKSDIRDFSTVVENDEEITIDNIDINTNELRADRLECILSCEYEKLKEKIINDVPKENLMYLERYNVDFDEYLEGYLQGVKEALDKGETYKGFGNYLDDYVMDKLEREYDKWNEEYYMKNYERMIEEKQEKDFEIDKNLNKENTIKSVEVIYSEVDILRKGEKLKYEEVKELYRESIENAVDERIIELKFIVDKDFDYTDEFLISKGGEFDLTKVLEQKVEETKYVKSMIESYLDENDTERKEEKLNKEKANERYIDKSNNKEREIEMEC